MLKSVGKKLHKSRLKGKAAIFINAVGTIKIVYKEAGIKANIKRIIIADKKLKAFSVSGQK